jgi:hypothetical protein
MVNVGIFYDHLENFMAIWYNLWLFGIVCGHLLYFSQFGMFGQRKVWQPWYLALPSQHMFSDCATCSTYLSKKTVVRPVTDVIKKILDEKMAFLLKI